jgi:predicted kinase
MAGGAEVVLVMGVPGAGKSRVAGDYIRRGYTRLNRDQRGGSLRELASELDAELASGGERIVLDNTYLSRASRNDVIAVAARHGTGVHCVWADTPLAKAQVNLVERLLDGFGALPSPDALREVARREPGLLAPTSQMRAFRELEPPSLDEGFLSVERIEFEHAPGAGRRGVFVAAAAADAGVLEADRDAPTLVFDWNPSGDRSVLDRAAARIESLATGPVERALCAHPGGPPICWCRPPLPGLLLAFAREQGVDPASSVVVGSSAAHRTLANALGAEYVGA